jgi:hypothetical protein
LRRTPDGRLEFFLLRNWLPAADIDDILSTEALASFGVRALRPELQIALETGIGRDVFFDQELKGTQEFLGMKMDTKLVNILRTCRFLSTLDSLDPLGMTRKERMSAPALSRLTAFATGLKPTIVSPERERISRTFEREEDLRKRLGRARSIRARKQLEEATK